MNQETEFEDYQAIGVRKPLNPQQEFMDSIHVIKNLSSGSDERHKALRDLSDILAFCWDDEYDKGLKKAEDRRDKIKRGEEEPKIMKSEDTEIHQSIWLQEISKLMKRAGYWGEEFVRG